MFHENTPYMLQQPSLSNMSGLAFLHFHIVPFEECIAIYKNGVQHLRIVTVTIPDKLKFTKFMFV